MTPTPIEALAEALAAGGAAAALLEEWRPPGLTYLEQAHEAERRRRVLDAWDRALLTARTATIEAPDGA